MSASAAISSGAAIVEVANFLKEYMTAMEQLPRTAQLLASQMMDLDKNSHCTLIELEELTQPANFANGSVSADLRRRLKRSLIDLQTGADEQHRLLGDVGDGIQRYVHRLQAQRKQAEVQLRNLQNKAVSASKPQDAHEPSSSRDAPSSTKRKRVRESGAGSGTPAKHSKRQPKDASPGPSVASSSGSVSVRRAGASLAHRKASTLSSVSTKKTPASTPTATTPVTPNPPVSVKKKKKKKRKSITATTPNEKPPGAGGVGGPSEKAVGGTSTTGGSSGGGPGKGGRKRQEGGAGTAGGEGGVASGSSGGGGAHEEPRYCLCGGVSSGPMVACDGPGCQVEWFHFECVGLTEAPKGNWYCSNCEQNAARPSRRAKGKSTGSAASGTVGGGR